MGNNDPIDLPIDLPTHSISILYSFATGKESWSTEVFRSILTVIGYIGVMAKIPAPVAGASPEELRMFEDAANALSKPMDANSDQQVIQVLGALVDQQQQGISQGLIPWQLVLAWCLHKLLDSIIDKVKS